MARMPKTLPPRPQDGTYDYEKKDNENNPTGFTLRCIQEESEHKY